jgi:uncharacterized protein (TIGR03067 family)
MRTVLTALGVCMLSGALVAQGGGKKDSIEGTWVFVSGVKGGEKAPEKDTKGAMLTFAGGKLTVNHDGKTEEGTYKTDATQKPPQLEVTMKDKTHKGIYEVKGDTLRICMGGPDEDRPTQFQSPAGSKTMLIVLRREKKD